MSLDFDLNMKLDTGGKHPHNVHLFSMNVTHNVSGMWRKAGCYEALYESDGKTAGDVVQTIQIAYMVMVHNPEEYRKMDAPNGWGTYDQVLPLLNETLEACQAHPKATISISR